MPTFDQTKMSPDELQFIRAYCKAIQREYDLLQIIRGLMEPAGLGISCVITATKLATRLYAQQVAFTRNLEEIAHKYDSKVTFDDTPVALLSTIFTQSFFKIVDSETKQVFIIDQQLPNHDGWSSGHPIDWQHAIKSLQEIHKQKLQNKKLSGTLLVNALLKLFSILPLNLPPKSWQDEQEDSSYDDWEDSEDDDWPDYNTNDM